MNVVTISHVYLGKPQRPSPAFRRLQYGKDEKLEIAERLF